MRNFKVSDELYEQLKSFVVDPFSDTPEVVIGRLIEIVNKAKDRWAPFDVYDASKTVERSETQGTEQEEFREEEPVVVL